MGYLKGLDFDKLADPLDEELESKLTKRNLLKLEKLYFEEGNHFDLYNHNVMITSFKGLEEATNLTSLKLSYNNTGLAENGGIEPLRNHTKLVEVKLKDNDLIDISPLENNKGLKHLEIGLNKIKDISVLKNFPELETLDLEHNKIDDLSSIADLTKLKSLIFSYNQVENIEPLRNLVNLESRLWMENNNIQDITPLENLNKLKDLMMSNNQIKDVGALTNLVSLKTLWINYNRQITDWGCGQKVSFQIHETFYNTKRIHSHCDNMSPTDYEKLYSQRRKLKLGWAV